MTELTEGSLEKALMDIQTMVNDPSEPFTMKPTKLIVSRQIMNVLMWRPAIAKRRGVRGRRLAMKQRARAKFWRFFP